jgi:hypothetical protein
MPLIIPPQLIGVGVSDYALTFSYDFSQDNSLIAAFNISGVVGRGSVYTLNTSNTNGVGGIPPFKNMMICQSYTTEDNQADGELVVLNQSVGQVYRFGMPGVPVPTTAITFALVKSLVVPILPISGPVLQFAKCVSQADPNVLFGKLYCTLFTGNMRSFADAGYSYTL